MEYQLYLKGYVGGVDFDANYVDWVLNNKYKDTHVDVLISSTGGSLDTALKIAAAFRLHGDVHVHFVGFNASAATIASMGAKHITMESCAFYLVHQCSQEIFLWDNMNKEDLQKLKDNIDKTIADLATIDEQISALYASKTSKDMAELTALMKKGGWLNAEQAKAWGFIDEIKDTEQSEPQQLSDMEIAAMVKNGMPAPPQSERKNGLIKSIVDEIRNFLKPNKKTVNMKHICQLLNVDSLNSVDDNITLSQEQAQAIEDYIMAHEAQNEPETETAEQPEETTEETADEQQPAENEPATEPEPEAKEIKVINNGTTAGNANNDYFKTRKNAQELYNLIK